MNSPADAPVLSVSHFQKRYGDTIAVRDLSLTVEPGDIYGFIGHNGAGKTTLIRSIVGVQPFDGGSIDVAGIDVTADPVAAKRLSPTCRTTPTSTTFMTGLQYLDVHRRHLRGAPPTTARSASTSLAGRLEHHSMTLASPIGSYSHGMRQKLVVIGALLHEPKLLDARRAVRRPRPASPRTSSKSMLHELAARGGAVFFSSHVLEVVEKLCNKVAIIRKGELVRAGTTDEVRGDDSLEDVFLELAEVDAAAPDGASSEDGRHA